MAGLSNKISNIIGTKIPTYIYNQLLARSDRNSLPTRDNNNIRYLANKSAWIRLISSVDISQNDIDYFNNKGLGINVSKPEDLAKNYVLFAGTSKYRPATNDNTFGYDLRSGINKDGAYNLFNDKEKQEYGLRPMPGITSVNIETQGALGSVRGATINFKVWDKDQLDVMDALYFKLGFTMFLEWGNTFFYKGVDSITSKQTDDVLHSTEDYSIDPFSKGLTKEDLNYKIGQNVRETEGNYDAMLGVVSNFNFSFNQAGGYDCTLKLMALGYLGDSIKINHSATLPNILEQEIKQVESILSTIEAQKTKEEKDQLNKKLAEQQKQEEESKTSKQSILSFLNENINSSGATGTFGEPTLKSDILNIINTAGITNSSFAKGDLTSDNFKMSNIKNYDFIYKNVLFLSNLGVEIQQTTGDTIQSAALNASLLKEKLAVYSNIDSLYKELKSDSSFPLNNVAIIKYPGNNGITTIEQNGKFSYSGETYQIVIDVRLPDVTYSPEANKEYWLKLIVEDIINKQIISDFLSSKISLITYDNNTKPPYALTFSGTYKINLKEQGKIKQTTALGNVWIPGDVHTTQEASFFITINDSTLLSKVQPIESKKEIIFTDYIKKLYQQKNIDANLAFEDEHEGDVTSLQNKIGTFYNSSLEIILRTIQIHCFGNAIKERGSDIEKTVFKVELATDPIRKEIFSEGIFTDILDELIYNKIDDNAYINTPSNPEARLKVFCKYGFNTDLLANKIKVQDLKDKQVDYASLLMCYVVPYEINNQLEVGISLTHPVYMQFGLLLMILNHMCTIYDRKKGPSNEQTPLVYIDFNPNTNFCLSNNKHLSTDPFSFLIPIQGDISKNYPELFDSSILTKDKQNIIALDEKDQKIPQTTLFTADDNILSRYIPAFKVDGKNAYRGSTMNVLLSIEYILNLVKQYSTKDEKSSIYLKPFLEQIISDMNKSLGNINLFRLAYNDAGNTYHIIDDQFVPGTEEDDYISKDGKTELPLYGLKSIAKSLEIKTEISTKLANMIAISSNADSKYSNSTNATDTGLINTGYTDRYINNKTEISSEKEKSKPNAAVINSAIKFDQTIKEFYGSIRPSTDSVAFATNYYINKMSKVKSEETGSRASALIPVSVNFTTDGISGMNIGQGFTVPNKFLPYTYNERNVVSMDVQKVGFVILGVQNSFESNQWNTSIRANMIFLKDADDFKSLVANQYSTVNKFKGASIDSTAVSGVINVGPITKDVKDFATVTKQVIANLEGGYADPRKVEAAGLDPKGLGRNSGETMFGIDRKNFTNPIEKAAFSQFWKLIDENKASWPATRSMGFIPEDPLKTTLVNLVVKIQEAEFNQNVKNYISNPELEKVIKSDGRLLFNFIYATWNGPGYFQKFSKEIAKTYDSGKKTSEELLKRFIELRLNSRIIYPTTDSNSYSLIRQGGIKIASLVGVKLV